MRRDPNQRIKIHLAKLSSVFFLALHRVDHGCEREVDKHYLKIEPSLGQSILIFVRMMSFL